MKPDVLSLQEHFNDNASPRARARISAFIDKILAARPDLQGQPFYVPSNGRVATTVIAGDEVFKTTADKRKTRELARELDILEIFAAHDVPFMPRLSYVSADRDFFGMKKMPGVTLESVIGQMTEDDFMRFAEDFGRARAAIDNALAGCKLPESRRFHNRREYNSTAVALRLWDKPYMQATLAACDDDMRAMLSDYHDRLAAGRQLFCHIDLNKGNLLVDPVTKRLTGFIDVARACQTSFPEPEFEKLFYLNSSHAFVARAYQAYGESAHGQGVRPFDLAAYTALSTFGFWHKDSGRKPDNIVKRGIDNCIDSLPRAKAWLPGG